MASLGRCVRLITRVRPSLALAAIPRTTTIGCLHTLNTRECTVSNKSLLPTLNKTRHECPRCYSRSLSEADLQERVLNICRVYSPNGLVKTCSVRNYSAKEPLTLDMIQQRVLLVLKLYDKISPEKLTMDSHFMQDLGLDSLDHVEVIMAMEDEFGFEIPDGDAEKLLRPADIIRYVADKEDIYD